ncbi:uncharacterized protein LOC117176946 [Belonocnema kinseyi]|uniref:uncharacterized protein LOC117176946 n=1 Tax=Belonocnema kinseyi TaxID=2817044 RepID=UPI00143CEAA7|nr:uncharacterized protein LOC117176946 [Belonocnema kinseyi]
MFVQALTRLHNFIITEELIKSQENRRYAPWQLTDQLNENEIILPVQWRQPSEDVNVQRNIADVGGVRGTVEQRNRMADYFMTAERTVAWQWTHLRTGAGDSIRDGYGLKFVSGFPETITRSNVRARK